MMRTSSKNKIVARVEANGVEFDQQQTPAGGVHTLTSSHSHGIYTWIHEDGKKTSTMLHQNVDVSAEEYLLPGFDEPTVRIEMRTVSGGAHSVTFFNMTASQLIEALEAARMANTPEALSESAQ